MEHSQLTPCGLLEASATCGGAWDGEALLSELDLPSCPDTRSCSIGDDIFIEATVVIDGTEVVGPFGFIQLAVEWNPDVASVKNAGVNHRFGNGAQIVTAGPGVGGAVLTAGAAALSGSGTPLCSNDGSSCSFLGQTNASFDTITLDAQTLVATLVLIIPARAS